MKDQPHLYREIAQKVSILIDRGTFRTGDRLPSIRVMSRQNHVSINTVKAAYSILEDQCLIEARPQSGYYVAARLPEIPREPEMGMEVINPHEISSSELVGRIMRDVMDPTKVQFGAAVPDPQLIPAQKLSRILASETRRCTEESVSYAMPPGSKRLRIQVAKRMLKAGCAVNPDDIIITSGASEAAYLALSATCRPGDTVAIGAPIYFNFVQLLQELGLRVIEIPSSPKEGLHLESLKQVLEKTKISCCLVISNINNPLGVSLTDDRKEELVAMLEGFDVPLVEDDINGDLCFNEDRPSVAKSWDKRGNVLLCSSFSKTLAPGYRVGWIAPGRYREAVFRHKLVTNIASASPPQLAIAEFLENGGYEHHLRTIRKNYAMKLGRMGEAIGKSFPGGTRVTRPEGGFALWLELPGTIDSLNLYAMAVKEGITIAPGSLFSTSGKFTNCLRLNGAFWSEDNRWAIERLGEMAGELAGKK